MTIAAGSAELNHHLHFGRARHIVKARVHNMIQRSQLVKDACWNVEMDVVGYS